MGISVVDKDPAYVKEGLSTLEGGKFKQTTNGGKVAVRICADASDPVPVELAESDLTDNTRINEYDSVSSVASSSSADIVSYTVPVGKTFYLELAEFSGDNIAEYTLTIDAVTEASKRTYWADFNGQFTFNRFKIDAGSVVKIVVSNFRPSTGDFEGRLLGLLRD